MASLTHTIGKTFPYVIDGVEYTVSKLDPDMQTRVDEHVVTRRLTALDRHYGNVPFSQRAIAVSEVLAKSVSINDWTGTALSLMVALALQANHKEINPASIKGMFAPDQLDVLAAEIITQTFGKAKDTAPAGESNGTQSSPD